MVNNSYFNLFYKKTGVRALVFGISFFISAVLGILRDRLLAKDFGASKELDVYFAAFRIPDLVYSILVVGGLSAVFLPILAEYFKKDKKEGWKLVNIVFNAFLLILIILCAILSILTPWLIKFIAPGFDNYQKSLVIPLTRLMFFSPVLFGLSAIFSSVLHYFDRFIIYSFAPILYNLGIISGIVFFAPHFGIMGLGLGVILGAFLHWIVQIPVVFFCGYRYSLNLDFKYPGLLKIFKFMIWRVSGALVPQINLIVITAIASTLTLVGSITIFNFANNISKFITGIIGVSFATAVFPGLSRFWVNKERDNFLRDFYLSFMQILIIVVPLSILIFILREQIVKIILEGGLFGSDEVKLTSSVLGVFCFSIFAFALVPLLLRTFFALHDVRTPTTIGLVYMVLTIISSFLFVNLLSFDNSFKELVVSLFKLNNDQGVQIIGLSLALSFSGIMYFILLLFFLMRRLR